MMGKLFICLKYVFFVFSSDINEKRKHVHIHDKNKRLTNLCKFWIEPSVKLAYNYGFSKKELNEIKILVIENEKILLGQLKKFHDGKKIKAIKKDA